MRVLVLGGNGFIGSHVVDMLLSAKHDVNVYGRSAEVWRDPLPKVNYFIGDLSDTSKLAQSLEGVDTVIHLISTTTPSTSNLDPIADINNNLINTVKFLELMSSSKVKRIVYFSSGGTVYGLPSITPVPETHSLNPICTYGVVKVAVEKYLGVLAALDDFESVIIRASNPYGPRQGHLKGQGVIPIFMRQVLKGEKIKIWGDGTIKRDYIYVTDLAKFCLKAVESSHTGVFNVGYGLATSLNEIVSLINSETNLKAGIEYSEARKFDVNEIALDISKAKEIFNWSPSISIEKGLALHHEWLKNNNLI